MSKPVVYVVHAVDVEGPMTETSEATFERMQAYGLPKTIPATERNLRLIQQGKFEGIDKGLAGKLKIVFNPHSLGYLTCWKEIDDILSECTSEAFRTKYCSSDGSPYTFSWFVYDHHEGFTDNPRFHEVGTHKIFDHYMDLFLKKNEFNDGVYWHYHHPSINGHALEANTCWTNSTTHEEIIARRIIERKWYFSCFRAGLHLERNDVSRWLEMFFPFDFSARYTEDDSVYPPGSDFDWRGCPNKWGAWHPDWSDYRKQGGMRRWLFRCTDLWTYLNILTEEEVSEAFEQALQNGDSVLTYYNHDYRDIRYEIRGGYEVIRKVAERYPDVEWKFVTAVEAAQSHLGFQPDKPKLTCELNGDLLHVRCKGKIFGPQPFLAIQERNCFFRDNFTDEGNNTWAYRFRNLNDVAAFGVAANSPSGMYDICVRKLR